MKVTPWMRAVAGVLLVLGSIVLVLVAKEQALALFLEHRAIGTLLALALFLAAVLVTLRVLRVPGLSAAAFIAPLAFLLVVDLIVSPLPYELAHEVARLPHPPGVAIAPFVDTADQFEVNHPSAFVVFDYPDGTNVTQLQRDAIDTFRVAGWRVDNVQMPSSASPVGSVHIAKGALNGFCTFGDARGVAMQCALGV